MKAGENAGADASEQTHRGGLLADVVERDAGGVPLSAVRAARGCGIEPGVGADADDEDATHSGDEGDQKSHADHTLGAGRDTAPPGKRRACGDQESGCAGNGEAQQRPFLHGHSLGGMAPAGHRDSPRPAFMLRRSDETTPQSRPTEWAQQGSNL